APWRRRLHLESGSSGPPRPNNVQFAAFPAASPCRLECRPHPKTQTMNTPTRVLECNREADAVKGTRAVTSSPRRRPFLRLGLLGLTAAVLLGCKTLKFDTLLNHQDDPP